MQYELTSTDLTKSFANNYFKYFKNCLLGLKNSRLLLSYKKMLYLLVIISRHNPHRSISFAQVSQNACPQGIMICFIERSKQIVQIFRTSWFTWISYCGTFCCLAALGRPLRGTALIGPTPRRPLPRSFWMSPLNGPAGNTSFGMAMLSSASIASGMISWFPFSTAGCSGLSSSFTATTWIIGLLWTCWASLKRASWISSLFWTFLSGYDQV